MATYAISDLHGACDEFTRLLERIRFRYDGSDALYLLGDFGDWGAKSMETIQMVKALDEAYAFVHCLAGNHEMMFLDAIEGGIVGDEASDAAVNWLIGNRGLVTWNAYCALPADAQDDLHRWLRALPFSYDVVIGGKRIMLAHAYPYHYDMNYTEDEIPRRQRDAAWRRLMPHEDPFASYTGTKHYDGFICGHTIVQSYWRKRYLEQNPGVVDSVAYSVKNIVPGGRNRIYHGDKFIDIDCGAKCFAYSEELGGTLESVKKAFAEQAQLAAYCLDTDVEFYVGRPGTVVSTALDGNVDVAPSLDLPEVEPVKPPAQVHRVVKAARKVSEKRVQRDRARRQGTAAEAENRAAAEADRRATDTDRSRISEDAVEPEGRTLQKDGSRRQGATAEEESRAQEKPAEEEQAGLAGGAMAYDDAELGFSRDIPDVPAQRREPVEYPDRKLPRLNIPKHRIRLG